MLKPFEMFVQSDSISYRQLIYRYMEILRFMYNIAVSV